MRRIVLLGAVILVLIGSGIVTIQWGKDSATIKFNRERAKERTEQLLDKARKLEASAETEREQIHVGVD
ncbi:MAG: hypothetical protein A2W31_12795 [Planctomycetes bacterium RBG_16_64_10]|nr:MAG: hypothetical protein A2W31_12795 [Planctomycetes bacterium RBG_16_64_10]